MRTGKKQRIRGLDSLRAVAILQIVLFHTSKRVFPGGYLGVCFFLSLSGFLLMTRELQRLEETSLCKTTSDFRKSHKTAAAYGEYRPAPARNAAINRCPERGGAYSGYESETSLRAAIPRPQKQASWFSTYLIRRAQRIYPEMMLTLAVTSMGAALIAPGAVLSLGKELISTIAGVQNWWRIRESQSYFSTAAEQDPFGHLWYLSLQWQLYLLFPLILLLYTGVKKISKRLAVSLMTLITLISMADMPVRILTGGESAMTAAYYAADARAFSFLAGCTLAAWLDHPGSRNRWISKGDIALGHTVFLTTLISQGVLLMTLHGDRRFSYLGGMQLATLGSLLLIWLAQDRSLRIGKRLDSLPLRWIGRLSYEIYLVHVPVILWARNRTQSSPMKVRILSVIGSALLIWMLSLFLWNMGRLQKIWPCRRRIFIPLAEAACMLLACVILLRSSVYQDHRAMVQQLNESSQMLAGQTAMQNAGSESASKEDISGIASDYDKSEDISGRHILAVGDSVMLGAADALERTFSSITVNASEGRQEHNAISEVADLISSDSQIDTVILALGTNGYFTESDGQKMIDEIGPDRDIYWITVYNRDQPEFQDSVNDVIEKLAQANPNVHAIAWDKEAPLHAGWFWEDGIHLDTDGQKGYADYIKGCLI